MMPRISITDEAFQCEAKGNTAPPRLFSLWSASVSSTRIAGQAETEDAARAYPVLHPDSSAMTLDNALGNEQTEAHTPPIILGQLDEAVKNRFQFIVRNAFACVADATDHILIDVLEAYDD